MGAAYRGLTPTVLALLPTWALYFTAYERFKTKLSRASLARCAWPAEPVRAQPENSCTPAVKSFAVLSLMLRRS